MPYLFVCGGACCALLVVPALLAARLFTESPAMGLSLLAIAAVVAAKVFGATCFAFADQRWVRAGGLVLAVLCAVATAVPFWSVLASQVTEAEFAWRYLDRLLGQAPGSVKATFAITAVEMAGIGFLCFAAPHGEHHR